MRWVNSDHILDSFEENVHNISAMSCIIAKILKTFFGSNCAFYQSFQNFSVPDSGKGPKSYMKNFGVLGENLGHNFTAFWDLSWLLRLANRPSSVSFGNNNTSYIFQKKYKRHGLNGHYRDELTSYSHDDTIRSLVVVNLI